MPIDRDGSPLKKYYDLTQEEVISKAAEAGVKLDVYASVGTTTSVEGGRFFVCDPHPYWPGGIRWRMYPSYTSWASDSVWVLHQRQNASQVTGGRFSFGNESERPMYSTAGDVYACLDTRRVYSATSGRSWTLIQDIAASQTPTDVVSYTIDNSSANMAINVCPGMIVNFANIGRVRGLPGGGNVLGGGLFELEVDLPRGGKKWKTYTIHTLNDERNWLTEVRKHFHSQTVIAGGVGEAPRSKTDGVIYALVDTRQVYQWGHGLWMHLGNMDDVQRGAKTSRINAGADHPKSLIEASRDVIIDRAFMGPVREAERIDSKPTNNAIDPPRDTITDTNPDPECSARAGDVSLGDREWYGYVWNHLLKDRPCGIGGSSSLKFSDPTFIEAGGVFATTDTREFWIKRDSGDWQKLGSGTPSQETFLGWLSEYNRMEKENMTARELDNPSILKTLSHDATDAAWRTAGKQFVRLARDPLTALLLRNLAPGDEAMRGKIAMFLSTDIGEAMLGAMLSFGLLASPSIAGDTPARLAQELRIASMAGAGDMLAEVLMEPLRQMISSGILGNALAATTTPGVRVVSDTTRSDSRDNADVVEMTGTRTKEQTR